MTDRWYGPGSADWTPANIAQASADDAHDDLKKLLAYVTELETRLAFLENHLGVHYNPSDPVHKPDPYDFSEDDSRTRTSSD